MPEQTLYELWEHLNKPDVKKLKCMVSESFINKVDKLNRTALINAIILRDPKIYDIIKFFIDIGANIDSQDSRGRTALMYAVRTSGRINSENVVRLLIKAGADLNLKDKQCVTALMLAVNESNKWTTENTVKVLIDAGADTTNVFDVVHNDKRKVLYDTLFLPLKIAFGLGRLDPDSIVSRLPREICRVILDFVETQSGLKK